MSPRQDDEELISRLYQQGTEETPSAQVDAAVLLQAQQELKKRKHKSLKPHWTVPLSVAATIMISAALVILLQDETIKNQVPVPVNSSKKALEKPTALDRDTADSSPAEEQIEYKTQPYKNEESEEPAVQFAIEAEQPSFDSESVMQETQIQKETKKRQLEETQALKRAKSAQQQETKRKEQEAKKKASATDSISSTSTILPAQTAANPTTQGAADIPAYQADPKMWLEHIKTLRRQGKNREAEEQLHLLKQKYPQFEIKENQ